MRLVHEKYLVGGIPFFLFYSNEFVLQSNEKFSDPQSEFYVQQDTTALFVCCISMIHSESGNKEFTSDVLVQSMNTILSQDSLSGLTNANKGTFSSILFVIDLALNKRTFTKLLVRISYGDPFHISGFLPSDVFQAIAQN